MPKTLIIAEAGVNHNGSLELACKLVDAAAEAGVDYVKFQTFKAERLVSYSAPKASYQQAATLQKNETQYEMLRKLELSEEAHRQLVAYCCRKGVKFFSTAFDLPSIDFLASLRLGLWKIPSGEITNYPYLKRIAKQQEAVILSTGMSTMAEVEAAVRVLLAEGVAKEELTLLHCNTEYPTPMEDVNLQVLGTMRDRFGVSVGYSDHTQGIEVPVAAVALGATVIEKHFTLDKTMEGPDHQASLEPDELKEMVTSIRHIEKALGKGIKEVTPSEYKNRTVARKSIVAACFIGEGELFTEQNLTVKRPATGLSPMCWNEIIGKRASKAYHTDDLIEE